MHEEELQKWFSDPAFRPDWQDIDLILADIELLPQLATYLSNSAGSETKKCDVVLALLILIEDFNANAENEKASEIISTIRKNATIAERAMLSSGPIPELMIRRILNKEIPKETPAWLLFIADQKLTLQHEP